jgi:uncharacterized damage-inducible protein DinB
MKEILIAYATYHNWANRRLMDTTLSLKEEQQLQEVKSSFNSLHATWQHLWDAESIWWQRLKLQEHITRPSGTPHSMQEIAIELSKLDGVWMDWIAHATETNLQYVFAYYNSKSEFFKQPVWQMLMHLFNHGTYHRGQIVTLLREVGVTKIPGTDYITWSRKK